MSQGNPNRVAGQQALEGAAEVLVVHQIDLLSQLEAQLRAVHKTMRCIETLRSDKLRVGPELHNGERATKLRTLASELTAIDRELQVQHESCADMLRLITQMQQQLSALQTLAAQSR
jgi:hypothetical protein